MPWCQMFWNPFSLWWFFPGFFLVFMLVMMILMFLRCHGRGGCCGMGMRPTDEALEILRRRFASGEISQQDFEERRRALRSPNQESS